MLRASDITVPEGEKSIEPPRPTSTATSEALSEPATAPALPAPVQARGRPTTANRRRRSTWRAVLVVLVVAAQIGAVTIFPHNGWAIAVIPLAIGAALLAVAALCRFEWFIAALLLARPLLDILKGGGPELVQPTTLLSLLLLLVGPVWLVAQRRHSGRLPLTALVVVTGAFVASFALSAAGAADVLGATSHVVRAASWLVMLLVIRRLADDRKTLMVALGAFAASAVLPAVVSIFELGTPGYGRFMELKDGVERLRSTFDQSNNYARYLMLMLLVAVPALALVRGKGRALLGAGTLLLLPLLFLTYARAAWVGLAAGLLAMAWATGRRRLVGAVAVLGLGSLAIPGVLGALGTLARPDTGTPGSTNNSVAWRFSYWKQISSLGLQHPLTGIGPNGTVTATVDAKEPHNEYLRAAIEGGLIGLILYLALLTVATVVAVRVVRRATSSYQRAVGLAGLGVIVAVIVAGAASNIVLSVSFMWYFAFVVGVVDSVARAQFVPPALLGES